VRILAFHAHPDDCESLAGGTLVLLAAQQHEITIATMTPGDCGSRDCGPEAIAATRRREAMLAAQLIGARYLCAEFRDFAVFDDAPSRARVTEILRRTRPELILTASPEDPDCDHAASSALVRNSVAAAAAPNFRTGAANAAPPLPEPPPVYFMDPLACPGFIVDIESAFPRKQRMLAQHRSQRDETVDYLERMERRARLCGSLAGLELGEGFASLSEPRASASGIESPGQKPRVALDELLGDLARAYRAASSRGA
jgi:LmbE family N-acetylglucosaminyl deacetylase